MRILGSIGGPTVASSVGSERDRLAAQGGALPTGARRACRRRLGTRLSTLVRNPAVSLKCVVASTFVASD